MANKKVTTPPATSTPDCAHCARPAIKSKQIIAANKVYCGKLCAALGLIIEVNEEDEISEAHPDFLTNIVDECLRGWRPIPIKVRYIEGLAFHDRPDAEETEDYRIVLIEDHGTPDWRPDKLTAIWCQQNPGECLTEEFKNARALLSSTLEAAPKARKAAAAR